MCGSPCTSGGRDCRNGRSNRSRVVPAAAEWQPSPWGKASEAGRAPGRQVWDVAEQRDGEVLEVFAGADGVVRAVGDVEIAGGDEDAKDQPRCRVADPLGQRNLFRGRREVGRILDVEARF